MAFKAEDGTGLADANSLVAVAYADAYFTDRVIVAWTGAANPAKQAALIAATDYIEMRFGTKLKEDKLVATQALCFPRSNIAMPEPMRKAVCEYALRALAGTLTTDTASGPQVIATESAVGPIVDKVQYAPASGSKYKSIPSGDQLMKQFLRGTGLIRA